jgi:hypothetical protein
VTGPQVILQVPAGGRVDRQLAADPGLLPAGVVPVPVDADPEGRIAPPIPGRIAAALPSPEALLRERAEVGAALAAAGPGAEPLVVTLGAASELRAAELDAVLDVARHARRDVIVTVLGDG